MCCIHTKERKVTRHCSIHRQPQGVDIYSLFIRVTETEPVPCSIISFITEWTWWMSRNYIRLLTLYMSPLFSWSSTVSPWRVNWTPRVLPRVWLGLRISMHLASSTLMHPQSNPSRRYSTSRVHTYLRELLEGQLESAPVVGGTLRNDALHRFLQLPFVADVGLHQILEAGRVRRLVIELEARREGGMMGSGGKALAHIYC